MSVEPDVVVIGAGPAGSSVSGLLKKYCPQARVLLVEKQPFPRHHIGESFVADTNRLLHDLGVYDQVARAGFVPKYGSTFVWGRDRTPWSLEFQDIEAIPGYAPRRGYQTGYTWHVRRDEYDSLLLEHARELGVDVVTGVSASVSFDADERASSVALSDGRTLHPRFVVDATGQRAQLARQLGTLTFDPELQNVAVYAYFEGASLDPALSGTWEQSRIAIVSVDEGWIWYIPLARGLVSVGVVTSKEAFARRRQTSVTEFFDGVVRSCPQVAPFLGRATRMRYPGADADVLVLKDYCYSVRKVHGPGWALCGDAGGFVDPILSVGCYLAHTAASHLAYSLSSILSGEPVSEALCLTAYAEQLQFGLQAFRRMTYMFYGFNASKESWWWEAKRILSERSLPASVVGKSAFLALATGYGINRPVYEEAISGFGVNFFDESYRHLVSPDGIHEGAGGSGSQTTRYRRRVKFHEEPWVVPVEGTGRMRSVSRVTFSDETGSAVAGRLLLPDHVWRFLSLVDERSPADAVLALDPSERGRVVPWIDPLLRGLVDMGVLEPISGHR